MKNNWITIIWTTGWVLFALTHVLLFWGYFGSGETDKTMRQLAAVMSWGWFGIFPLLGLSLVSPILTLVWWKQLDSVFRKKGILLPIFLLLGCFGTSLILTVVINI
jgi:hypothetical protein